MDSFFRGAVYMWCVQEIFHLAFCLWKASMHTFRWVAIYVWYIQEIFQSGRCFEGTSRLLYWMCVRSLSPTGFIWCHLHTHRGAAVFFCIWYIYESFTFLRYFKVYQHIYCGEWPFTCYVCMKPLKWPHAWTDTYTLMLGSNNFCVMCVINLIQQADLKGNLCSHGG